MSEKTSDKSNDGQSPGQLLWENSIYYFSDDFTSKSTAPVIKFIMEKNLSARGAKPKELTLIINSPGGHVHAAFALIDVMKASSIPIKTVGLGMIASCGILTFMAGEKGSRILTPNTSILSHQYSWGSRGKEHELYAVMREFELSTERMLAHYKKCTGLNEKKIREILLPPQDVWLSAEEAVKHGIADRIKKVY